MTINKQALVGAITKYRTDLTSAVKLHDPDFTNNAITRRRHDGVMKARAELLKSIPPESTPPKVTPASVLAGRAPRTADQVAVAQHEFGIVQRLLEAGRPVEEVILGSSPARLDAILAHAEVLPGVLGSSDPAAVVKDIHNQVFGQLVELGDPNATIARDAQVLFDTDAAWRRVLVGTLEGEGSSGALDGLNALFHADPDGFRELAAANTDPIATADTTERVRQLDRTFGVDARV